MSFTHAVRRALTKLRYPKVDGNGNLLTNGVVPRNESLAGLLSATETGDNELAVSDDEDVLVVYKDGSPVIHTRSRHYERQIYAPSVSSVATGTQTLLIDGTTNPGFGEAKQVLSGENKVMRMDIHCALELLSTVANASYFSATLEEYVGVSWGIPGDFVKSRRSMPNIAGESLTFQCSWMHFAPAVDVGDTDKIRIMVEHDEGSDVPIIFGRVVVDYYDIE